MTPNPQPFEETAMTTTTKRPATAPITANGLIRVSGLFAIAAGAIFAGIQPIHPADVLASVTTLPWAVIISLKFAMCLFFLVGIAGLYLRQMDRAGWLGFAGFALFTLSWWLQTGYVFVDLFVLPPLASTTPQFIDSFLGIVNGFPGQMDIGAMVPVYGVLGLLYLGGGLLLGVATVRAGVLPRLPSILLAAAAVVTPFAALLPHAIQRYAAIPMGIAFIWLGLALWTGLRTTAAGAGARAAGSAATA
jgi:hypothetical protein